MSNFAYKFLYHLSINTLPLKVTSSTKLRIMLTLTLKTLKIKFKLVKQAVKLVK